MFRLVFKFSQNQPRDERGRWSNMGARSIMESAIHEARKPAEVIATDLVYDARYGHPKTPAHLTHAVARMAMERGGVRDRSQIGQLVRDLSEAHPEEFANMMDNLGPGERWILLHRGDEKTGVPTVWLLGWHKDKATEIHDHQESEVGVHVIRGAVSETVFHMDPTTGRYKEHSRVMGSGHTVGLGAPYIHEVRGTSPSDGKGDITLHGYFPPLFHMRHFVRGGSLGLEDMGLWKEVDDVKESGAVTLPTNVGVLRQKHDAPCCAAKEESMDRVLKLGSDDQRMVWAEVYVPNVPDTDGDYMDAEGIQKMAYDFMRSLRLKSVDKHHQNKTVDGACVVESFIARKGDPDFIEGAWVVGMHIDDDDTWAAIKKGEINGYSIEATVNKKPGEIEIEIPPIITGKCLKADDHDHDYYVTYNHKGEFEGGRTSMNNGHSHIIKRGTITEEAQGHSHKFAFSEQLSKLQAIEVEK